ncbi:MAG: pyrroline-5-carboxylate reductase [Solirubrobacterales bacterium]|nr:pyrroline-5-carboxylate reductase [Solirubrobacterales bacterium]
MARALARGWGEPVLCSDGGSGRAAALVAEVGGEALSSNAEVAERADLVVLCHKPAGLESVAAEIGGRVRAVASVLGSTPVAAVAAAYPGTPVLRFVPNLPVEVRRGVVVYGGAAATEADPDLERDVVALFARLGDVVPVKDPLVDAAMAISGCGTAFVALVAEAQVEAGVRTGLDATTASRLAVGNLAGTAALLDVRRGDTLGLRREVTSPGGSTARGLAALEDRGVRAAFDAAAQAVVHGGSR